jgi:hypothetical protein
MVPIEFEIIQSRALFSGMRELVHVLAALIKGLDSTASTLLLDVPELKVDEDVWISSPLYVSSRCQTKLICPAIQVHCCNVRLEGLEVIGTIVLDRAENATIANCQIHCPSSVKSGSAGVYITDSHRVTITQTTIFDITCGIGVYLRARQ